MTTTTIDTVPASLDVILDHAAAILTTHKYRNLPVARQAQFALGDAFAASGHPHDALYDVKLAVSDLLWAEAGEQNLSGYCESTRDVRKVVRLFRRAARKARA